MEPTILFTSFYPDYSLSPMREGAVSCPPTGELKTFLAPPPSNSFLFFQIELLTFFLFHMLAFRCPFKVDFPLFCGFLTNLLFFFPYSLFPPSLEIFPPADGSPLTSPTERLHLRFHFSFPAANPQAFLPPILFGNFPPLVFALVAGPSPFPFPSRALSPSPELFFKRIIFFYPLRRIFFPKKPLSKETTPPFPSPCN